MTDAGFSPPRPPVGTRVPPHNLEAESSLLGAMLLSRDAIGPAVEMLDASDFYKPADTTGDMVWLAAAFSP